MPHVLPLTMLASAGLGLALLATPSYAPAAREPGYFDPVLSGTAALCTPNGNTRRGLLAHYQKFAAATETRPFATTPAGSDDATGDAPLYDNLGTLSLPVTTNSPLAQRYFDQGLRMAYGFNHAEARRAFRAAQKHDPDCAMCYWGEAFVLGPNINAPMEAGAIPPAMAAVRMAVEKAGSASAREQALIAALAERYSADPKAERPALDAAFAAAMQAVAARFPDDENIQVLHVEALMNLSPWDYWEAGGAKSKGKTDEILTALETVLAKHPDHAGAIHYYIHMVEASAAPERAVPYARRLAAAMPGAGHLVHMPFHIYYRIGDYRAALAANKAAVAADEAYIAQAAPTGVYPAAYYPHNVHSLMVSAQMAGDGNTATAAAEKLARVVTTEAARTIPWVQPIQAAPFFAHAQFSPPRTVLAIADPGDELPFVKAMWHYARGVALAADRNPAAARREAAAIARLKAGDLSALTTAGIPAPDILDLAHQAVLARAAIAEGKLQIARAAFERAVAIQDRLAYSEPPYWYYPVRQSLGAVLIRLGRLDAAEEIFRASLAQAPNNGWALYGLAEVYRRMGRHAPSAAVRRRFENAWAGEQRRIDLSRL
jgi:tetratricopeptide (TPR) repeat protein